MYQRNMGFRFGGPLTPTVKTLMIINGVIFLIQQIAGMLSPGLLESYFGVSYAGVFYSFYLWQPFTYMFLHGGFWHIFFNLFTLWMFGGELENIWGGRKFLRYYLFSGLGAGLFILFMNYYMASTYGFAPPTIGASGAVYALLLAYGMTWPNREVLIYFMFPLKIKYMVLGLGLMEFLGTLSMASGKAGNISHIGHVGGIVTGFFLIKFLKERYSGTKKKSFVTDVKKKRRLQKKQNEINERIKAKNIINELLEKIARDGMSSLTSEEKKQLEWARKHYYPSGKETMH